MARAALPFAVALISVVAVWTPACAGDYGPFSWLFSTENGGPNSPAITPDRPYWHGDSAVPPSMRWHDRDIEIVDEYGFTIGTREPPPEAVVPLSVEERLPAVVVSSVVRRSVRWRHPRVKVARAVCPPPAVRPDPAVPPDVALPLGAPARAER